MKSFIFAKITLADDEFKLYREFFEMVRTLLVKPDAFVLYSSGFKYPKREYR